MVPSPAAGAYSTGWERLQRAIERCHRCPLAAHRAHVVVYRGAERPRVLFVGEAPGAAEDAQGIPFVGRAGKRLDAAIRHLGLGPEGWGVVNLLKCRPPGNRFDRRAAVACRPHLDRQVALLGPRVIVTLGAHALRAFAPGSPPISRAAGVAIRRERDTVFPLLHPAAALHAPRFRAQWDADLDTLARELPGLLGEAL